MKIEQAKKLAAEALGELMSSLDKGHSEALKAYLGTLARFHAYSTTNVLLIAMQMPRATHVAGFHSWRKLGRHVQKGEKGIMILAPIIYRRRAADEDAQQVQPVRGFKIKSVYVFDRRVANRRSAVARVRRGASWASESLVPPYYSPYYSSALTAAAVRQ